MKYITLEEIKQQARIDFVDAEEENLLNIYGDAAEASIIGSTQRKEEELLLEDGTMPSQLRLAMLMLTAHFYRNREPVSSVAQNEVPFTIQVLVKPFRRLKKVSYSEDARE